MKAIVIIQLALLLGLLTGPRCLAQAEAVGAGVATPTAADLRARGVSEAVAERVAATFRAAQQEGLPAESLHARLQEGLAKGVDAERVAAALEQRLSHLRKAGELLRAARYNDPAEPSHRDLLVSTARALESGLPADQLAPVLARGEGAAGGRMQTVVESGEALLLAGADAPTVRRFMDDCLDRNLRRMEVLRATRFSIQRFRGGMSGGDVRRALWGGDGEQGQSLRGEGAGRGGGGRGPMGPPSTTIDLKDETPNGTPPSSGSSAGRGNEPKGGGAGGGGSAGGGTGTSAAGSPAGSSGGRPDQAGSGSSAGAGGSNEHGGGASGSAGGAGDPGAQTMGGGGDGGGRVRGIHAVRKPSR